MACAVAVLFVVTYFAVLHGIRMRSSDENSVRLQSNALSNEPKMIIVRCP